MSHDHNAMEERFIRPQSSAYFFQHKGWCRPLQLSWIKLRTYIRECIVYSPDTFCSQNEICRKVEASMEASRPKNSIESCIKALNAEDLLPSHGVFKPLLTAYFNTWERLYRVVHKPSFWKDYYDTRVGIRQSSLSLRILTLAIMILGQQVTNHDSTESLQTTKQNYERFSEWTQCVENYCILLVDNERLDMLQLQILCLFALYKTTNCDRNEARNWTQSLVKCAVQAELHVDPSKLKGISVFDTEIRRRLWATVLEIDIQVSLDHGNALPWTANINHRVQKPSNIDDAQLHPGLQEPPLARDCAIMSDCSFQRVLYQSGELRGRLLTERFDRAKHMDATSLNTQNLFEGLDKASISPECESFDADIKRLLRLHILRSALQVLQSLTFHAANHCQLQKYLATYHTHTIEYLQVYLTLSPSVRTGCLLSSTLFDALSPVIYIDTDGFPLSMGIRKPSHDITDFVKSWSKYTFDDIDCLTDRALREKALFFFLSNYLKSKDRYSIMPSTKYRATSWRYGRLSSALNERRRTPKFYLELSEMAWSK
ncbi:unnamed protein product [Penicillium salamii]|nr:unnamed protein product [Penicillium salamii]CRL31134.1 Transcription factor, fungi [Penicillium camemberti]CAG7959298.1 unnamed protein product [Penicillium salamii]CAG7967287.1 unnamed protein product [Penicillium salamii]CAG7975870.1 unnamed protein product [Penicillium salamii]